MTQLCIIGDPPWSALTRQWVGALRDVVLRHPSRESKPLMQIVDGAVPTLCLALNWTRDSRDPNVIMRKFVISNVTLTYFPGDDLARKWLAAAWCGYLQHEALECCTVSGLLERPLDPHEPPYHYDRGLRDGLPVELTPETLIRALAVTMPVEVAEKLARVGSHG